MSLHPTASERNFKESIQRYLVTILNTKLEKEYVVDSDDYEALSDLFQDDSINQFVIYGIGEKHGTNQVTCSLAVAVLTRRDPGNILGFSLVDHLKEYLCTGLSIPFVDILTGDGEIITQMVIMNSAVGPWIEEEDDFRSKSFGLLVGYPQIWGPA